MEVLQRTANRGSISTGYDIDNSLKFEDDNDEWLYRTNASGTNTKTWTVSWWFKQTELRSVNGAATEHWTGGAYGEATRAGIFADDRIWIDIGGGDGNTGTRFRSLSTAKLRDTSAWYHIVIACDSTQSTEADRLKVWLNGVEVTAWDQHQIPTLNFASALAGFGGIQMKWGSADATYHGYSGYLAECNYVDGVTATQNDFGEFDADSGIWKPIEYTGSYGTNGCYLDFETASDLGANAKGDDRNFSLNNITAADQATDTPTNNFCTYNSIMYMFGNTYVTEGATKTAKSNQNWITPMPTMGVSKGKWYAEFEFVNTSIDSMVGVVPMGESGFEGSGVTNSNSYLGQSTNSIGYYGQQGNKYNNGSGSSYGNSYVAGDKMAVALDMDNGKVYFAKNGTWQNSGDPTSGSTGTGALDLIQPTETHGIASSIWGNNSACLSNYGGYTTISISSAESDANGYGTFEYAPPSGYYSICSQNLAEKG